MSEAAKSADELHRQQDLTTAKLQAEIGKLIAETARINSENKAYPWLPIATLILGNVGLIGAIVAIVVAFHK